MFLLGLQSPPPNAIDRILADPKLAGALVSVTVAESSGKVVYSHNDGMHMTPASNQKLLSNSFALHTLGAAYRPTTKFWRFPTRIVIETTGDPSMTYIDLMTAQAKLASDLTTLVYAKQAYSPGIPDGWEYDDLPNKYAAPITALTVDKASVELWARDGKLQLVPHSYDLRIQQRTGKSRSIKYDPFTRIVEVTGPLPEKPTKLDTLSLLRPDHAAASLLGTSLVPTTQVPDEPPTYVHRGSTVGELLKACLPPSDNNIAEHLLLLASAQKSGSTTYPQARIQITDFLTKIVGVIPTDFRVEDGSGMSRHNFVTTRGIAKLLHWCAAQPTANLWRDALVHPGSGTLSSRLKGIEFSGKTGGLDMVAAISGYVKCDDGKERVVSIILNNYGCTTGEARGFADAIIRSVVKG